MDTARSNPPRRKSSGASRHQPERVQSSSSIGSRVRSSRHERTTDSLHRRHDDSTTSRRSTRNEEHVSANRPTLEGLGDFSEEPEEWERGTKVEGGKKRKRKRDEPMSPIAVVGYVVFFYVIWQILTRSDETEILSHLPLHLQSLSSSHHPDPRSHQQSQYHLPYHIPQIPSPMPNTAVEPASTSGTIFGVVMYPFYLLITIIATIIPLLLNALYLLFHVVVTILYPVTATLRIFGRTFVLAPFNVVSSAVAVFYPLYVFIAGVIGVGCVLGLGVGWAGKLFLDVVFGRKRRSSGRKKSLLSARPQTAGSRSSQPGSSSQAFRRTALTPSSGEDREHIYTPRYSNAVLPEEVEEEDEDEMDYVSERYIGGDMRSKSSYGASRESPVVGLRQRGMRGSTSFR
jgi:hypothetical protein